MVVQYNITIISTKRDGFGGETEGRMSVANLVTDLAIIRSSKLNIVLGLYT